MIEVLLLLMLALAVASLIVRDLIAMVVLAAVFSLVSCLFFYLLGAPDVALTEAAVGTGIGSVVFVWIVHRTRQGAPRPGEGSDAAAD